MVSLMNDQIKTRSVTVTGNFSQNDFYVFVRVLRAVCSSALKRGKCYCLSLDFEPAENERNGKKQPDSDLIK